MSETMTLNYGNEEDLFHMHHIKRTEPFERTNHYHGTYEIYYLLSGQRAYFIKDRSYLILPGDLLFINKFEVHKMSLVGSPAHERIVINFSDTFINHNDPLHHSELFSAFHHPTSILRLKLQEQIIVQSIMSKLTRELIEKNSGYEIYTKLLLTELLLFASRFVSREGSAVQEHAAPQHRKITEIVRYINQSYSEPITLQHLAKQFYISPFYLCRAFKEVTGFTFNAYLNTTRMREAQKLLKESKLKIIEIAAAVGIDNVSHFGRTFKQLTGTTPVQYRKN
jgi:YesN/AraC family two-component response regulator